MICPDCKWAPPDYRYWVRSDGKMMTSKGHGFREYYPIKKDVHMYNGRKHYRLIHKCPKCNREIEIEVIEEQN